MDEEKLIEDFIELWGPDGRLRAEYNNFFAKQPINAQITLVFNQRLKRRSRTQTALTWSHGAKSLITLKGYLGKWLEFCERELGGSRFYKKPAEKRIEGFFFAEKLDVNAHLHGLLILPNDWVSTPAHELGTAATFNDEWRRLVPSGNIKLNTSAPAVAGAIYQTKEFKRQDFWGEMMMASDFWPASRTGALPGRGSRR